MAKTPKNLGSPWTPDDDARLRELARQNTPTRVIGLKLGRTEHAVRTRASEESISLRPWNRSPYNRRQP